MTSAEILDSIERSFDAKAGYLVIREVTVGRSGRRRADAIALQLYQSRGIHLHGFEVKVSRPDWLAELRDAAKADDLAEVCQHFSVVAPAGIVRVDELPDTWGLFEVRGAERRLFRVRAAAKLDPGPLSLAAAARVLRRAIEGQREPWIKAREAELGAAYQRGVAAGKLLDVPDRGHDWRQAHTELQTIVRAFEAASGIDLPRWLSEERAERLGRATRLVLEAPGVVDQVERELRRLAVQLTRLATDEPRPRLRFEDMLAAIDRSGDPA